MQHEMSYYAVEIQHNYIKSSQKGCKSSKNGRLQTFINLALVTDFSGVLNGRGEPEAVCDKNLICSKLNLTPKSYWCWWIWSTAQVEEIPSTHIIKGEDCRAEKSKTILVLTHRNLWASTRATISGLVFTTKFSGYRDSCVCLNKSLWPVPDLPSHYPRCA